jgi:hypothetical protein
LTPIQRIGFGFKGGLLGNFLCFEMSFSIWQTHPQAGKFSRRPVFGACFNHRTRADASAFSNPMAIGARGSILPPGFQQGQ